MTRAGNKRTGAGAGAGSAGSDKDKGGMRKTRDFIREVEKSNESLAIKFKQGRGGTGEGLGCDMPRCMNGGRYTVTICGWPVLDDSKFGTPLRLCIKHRKEWHDLWAEMREGGGAGGSEGG